MTAYPRPLRVAAIAAWAALFALSAFVIATEAQATEPVVSGWLATVEPATRRITFLPQGEADLIEVFAAEDCDVRLEDRPLTLADLVIHVADA